MSLGSNQVVGGEFMQLRSQDMSLKRGRERLRKMLGRNRQRFNTLERKTVQEAAQI
jgi:hypothetical protein